MTPRERILATFNHEVPSCIPTDGWFHQEVQKKLKEYYKTEDWGTILQNLGIEGWASLSPRLVFPEYERKRTEHPGKKPGKRAIWLDERTYKDEWGVRYRRGERGWYEEWIGGPLEYAQTVDDILNYSFPTVEQIREPENYSLEIETLKKQQLFVSAEIVNPYKMAWLLRGMDNVLADYLINVELLEALYDKFYDLNTEMALRMARAGVDMISVFGDTAMQDRIIMGPESWRKIDKPRMAKLIAISKMENPNLFFFIHSDGNVMDLMDDFVEIGFDVINPIQPECMNPVEVKKRWGDKITLHGCISLQRTLPFGTTDDVRNEVETLIRKCGYNGGLVLFPSNVIQPDTPVENIITCFHAARDFDVASLGGRPAVCD